MPGLGEQVGRDVYERLRSIGIEIRVDSLISSVDGQFMEFKNGERLEYDCLIWTAGVKARSAPFITPLQTDRSGRLMTNAMFGLTEHSEIFALGDQGCYMDPSTGRPMPGTARQAIKQGRYVGGALAALLRNQKPKPFVCQNLGYIVPLGGKWAIFKTPQLYFKGFLPYIARQIAWFHYYWTILGLRRAMKLSLLENKLYGRNDF